MLIEPLSNRGPKQSRSCWSRNTSDSVGQLLQLCEFGLAVGATRTVLLDLGAFGWRKFPIKESAELTFEFATFHRSNLPLSIRRSNLRTLPAGTYRSVTD